MTSAVAPQLVLRLIGLALLTVIVQVAAVSQIQVFGVNADLCRSSWRPSGCCAAR